MRLPVRLAIGLAAFAGATVVSAAPALPVDGPARVGVTAERIAPPADPSEQMGRQVIDEINARRAARGLTLVTWESRVFVAAQTQADYQASIRRLSHLGPGGTDTGDRLIAAGFAWSWWAENAGAGQTTASQIVSAWMTSPGHRDAMLGSFQYAAAAVAWADGTPYWTLVLANS